MSRIGRSFPSIHSGLHNASTVNPAPNLLPLPTIRTALVAVQRAAQSSIRRPLATKLRSPVVVNPVIVPLAFPIITKVLYAVPRAVQSSMRRPMSSRIRPPTTVNQLSIPPVAIQYYRQAVARSYRQAQRTPVSTFYPNRQGAPIWNNQIVNPRPNLFPLPVIKTTLTAVSKSYRQAQRTPDSTNLWQVPRLFFPPAAVFLPTLGSYTKITVSNSLRRAQRVPDYTYYSQRNSPVWNSQVVNPAANLSPLPRITSNLVAVRRSNETSLRRPLSTKSYRQPIYASMLFLPSITTRLQAVQSSYKAPRRPQSTRLLVTRVINAAPNLFPLPRTTVQLQSLRRLQEASQRRPLSTKLIPPTVINTKTGLFIPTITTNLAAVKMQQVVARRFKYLAKLYPPTVISPVQNLFLPTLGSHLQAATRATQSNLRRPSSTKLSQVPYLFFAQPPAFLPTIRTNLSAVSRAAQSARLRPLSTKLSAIAPTQPTLFLPTLGKVLDNKTRHTNRAISTKFITAKYTALPPFLPTLGKVLDNKLRHTNRASSTKFIIANFTASAPFLPTLSRQMYAVRSVSDTRRSYAMSTRLRPPSVINQAPNPFLPTLGRYLDRTKHTNRANATYLRRVAVSTLPPFIPSLGRIMYAYRRGIESGLRRPHSTHFYPATVLFGPPTFNATPISLQGELTPSTIAGQNASVTLQSAVTGVTISDGNNSNISIQGAL